MSIMARQQYPVFVWNNHRQWRRIVLHLLGDLVDRSVLAELRRNPPDCLAIDRFEWLDKAIQKAKGLSKPDIAPPFLSVFPFIINLCVDSTVVGRNHQNLTSWTAFAQIVQMPLMKQPVRDFTERTQFLTNLNHRTSLVFIFLQKFGIKLHADLRIEAYWKKAASNTSSSSPIGSTSTPLKNRLARLETDLRRALANKPERDCVADQLQHTVLIRTLLDFPHAAADPVGTAAFRPIKLRLAAL